MTGTPRRAREVEPVLTGGAEGNTRLTASLAGMLLILFFLEGVTLLGVRTHLSLHVFLGALLIPVSVFKAGTTTWRFAKYYWGTPQYVRKGPPHILLRLLGPFVVILTMAVLFSGLFLIVIAPKSQHNFWLLAHKASFVLWFCAMSVHVLGHIIETGKEATLDWFGSKRRQIAGAGIRQFAEIAALAVGIGMALWVTPHASNWVFGGQ